MNKINSFFTDAITDLVSRRSYSKIQNKQATPDLLGVQTESYKKFISSELEKLIQSFFPIVSASENLELHFEKIILKKPEISEFQAREQSKTYQTSLYVQLKLINKETGEVKSASGKNKENAIFFGDIPLMTEKGTFIVNGIEKFVISQIVRAPGAYMLTKSQLKLSNSRKKILIGTVCELLPLKRTVVIFYIPDNHRQVRIQARNNSGESFSQFSSTTLLKGLGLSHSQILEIFDHNLEIQETLSGESFNEHDIFKDSEIQEILSEISNAQSNLEEFMQEHEKRLDYLLYELLVKYYQKYYHKFKSLQKELENTDSEDKNYATLVRELKKLNESAREIVEKICNEKAAKFVVNSLSISYKISKSPCNSYQGLLWSYFFEKRMYDMGAVGRYKLNRKLRLSERLYEQILAEDIFDVEGNLVFAKGTLMLKNELQKFKELTAKRQLQILQTIKLTNTPKPFRKYDIGKEVIYEKVKIFGGNDGNEILSLIGVPNFTLWQSLTIVDILVIFSYLIYIDQRIGKFDDIDHLENKRLRLISELLRNRIQVAILRIEKFIREKMASSEVKMKHISLKSDHNRDQQVTVKSLINTKPFQIIVKEFFNSHQLTQFIDQQNPLSELTNKRRISAMGPGGINREDPNLDIRDVHYSHYGRICPIETPEGMNIGLIMSLATFSQIDEFGFITSPYYRVVNGKVTDEIKWLPPSSEDEYVITEAMAKRDEHNCLISPVEARHRSSIEMFDAKDVDYIDVTPQQVVSISAALIPFLENDDANRALMGANMQRQTTPLLKPYAPVVGTGLEYTIARDSGVVWVAEKDGTVTSADGESISIRYDHSSVNKRYPLVKFKRSNQDTCNNQTPIVRAGDRLKAKQIIVDGPAMQNGELALGQNVLIAFTTWSGYNYEDAIILSSRLVHEDIYTSVHIDEYTIECLRTKNGDEEITRQIPNVSSDAKRYLDENGIIMVGAEVREGDILVGKTSPKAQTEQTSEEKLLQVIFSEKVKQVKDSSLKVPHGGEGTVAFVKHFSVQKGDDLNDDVIEIIKVFIIQKRKIQVGDKMAGRHGNKGIVSRIVPVEDMPYLTDGTPVDIMLNPLGVPSRMNIGQVVEMHLGLAAYRLAFKQLLDFYYDKADFAHVGQIFGLRKENVEVLMHYLKTHLTTQKITSRKQAHAQMHEIDLSIILSRAGLMREDLGFKVSTPVFSGVNRSDLVNILNEAGIDPETTKVKFDLFDGRTGEKFAKPIAVGVMYMLKLDHMVDDKIHARSVGPYSKITQQPLGGKSQNGGQRFGEMEVWALEAYGAAYNLRELLTVKSDDVYARNAVYSAIIKNKKLPQPGLPESFKLLIKKLEGLCFKINVKYGDENSSLMNSNEFINKQLVEKTQLEDANAPFVTKYSDEINQILLNDSELENVNDSDTNDKLSEYDLLEEDELFANEIAESESDHEFSELDDVDLEDA